MPTLVLLRHGESDWNRENRFTGWTDVDLSATGIAEAHEAARLLAAEGLDVRRRLHLAAPAGDPDALARARGPRAHVAAGPRFMAPQRAPLRGAPGPRQGRDGARVRRRAGPTLAPQLRRPAAAARPVRRAVPRPRPALRGPGRRATCRAPSRSRTPSPGSCPTGTRRSRRRCCRGGASSSRPTGTACGRS